MRNTVDFAMLVSSVISLRPKGCERASSSRMRNVLRTTGTEYFPDSLGDLAMGRLPLEPLFGLAFVNMAVPEARFLFEFDDMSRLTIQPVGHCDKQSQCQTVAAWGSHRSLGCRWLPRETQLYPHSNREQVSHAA